MTISIAITALAAILFGEVESQFQANSPVGTLNSFCPCNVKLFCSSIFEGDEDIYDEILRSIPSCPGEQVRCCTKETMFTAINAIVNSNDGQGRSATSQGRSDGQAFPSASKSNRQAFSSQGQSAGQAFSSQGQSAGKALSTQGRSDGQAFSSVGQSTGPASSQVRTSFRQSPSANSAPVGDQQFFGASPSSQTRQRSSFSQQSQTPSFLPSVSPNNLGSDLFALGADSNSVGGLVNFLDRSNVPRVHTDSNNAVQPNNGAQPGRADTRLPVQGRDDGGSNFNLARFSQGNLNSGRAGRIASAVIGKRLECVPILLCDDSDIYGRDPDHFEDFGLVTDQRCSTKPGTVLCVVDDEDALFSSVQSTATFPSGATSSVQSTAALPSGATFAQSGSSLFQPQQPSSSLSSQADQTAAGNTVGTVAGQASSPRAPSVQIIGPQPVYVTYNEVKGPSVGGDGSVDDIGFVSSGSGQNGGQPQNAQQQKINSLLKSLKGRLQTILGTNK